MTGTMRIAERAESYALVANAETVIDSAGLNAEIWSENDFYVSLFTGAGEEKKCLVKSGKSFGFCGKMYVTATTNGRLYAFLYSTL